MEKIEKKFKKKKKEDEEEKRKEAEEAEKIAMEVEDEKKKRKEDEEAERIAMERELIEKLVTGKKTPRTPPKKKFWDTPEGSDGTSSTTVEKTPNTTISKPSILSGSAFLKSRVGSPEYEDEPSNNKKRGRKHSSNETDKRKKKINFVDEELQEDEKDDTHKEESVKLGELRKSFEVLKDVMEKLKKQSEMYTNVKREIKDTIREAARKTETVDRLLEEMVASDFKGGKMKQVVKSHKALQTNETDIMSEEEKRKIREREHINRVWKREENSIEDLKEIMDLQWENSRYARTTVVPTMVADVERAIVMIDIKGGSNQTRYPVVNKMTPGIKEHQVEKIGYSLDVESRHGREKEKKKFFVVALDLHMLEIKDAYRAVDTLKSILEAEEINKIHLEGLTADSADLIRKSLEYRLRRANIEITIEQMPRKTAKKKRILPEAVIVKAEGSNYADVLRKIKNGVNLEENGINVERVRKTNAGDLCIEIKGAEAAGKLKKEIQKNVNEAKIIHVKRTEQVCIFDIEPETTEKEVLQSLKKNITGEAHFRVASLRTTKVGCQIAVVECDKFQAEKLITAGRIKIGWTRCRIKPQVKITRCYRCLEYGHRRENCRGEDKSQNCYRCNDKGHLVKDCPKKEEYCIKCRKTGHRDDQFACPVFKEKMKEARERKRSNTLSRSMSTAEEDEVFVKLGRENGETQTQG